MRLRPSFIAAAAGAIALSACASTGGGSTYSSELRDLEADCRARDGILQPIPGAVSGRPAADNQCIIRGGSSDRIRTDR